MIYDSNIHTCKMLLYTTLFTFSLKSQIGFTIYILHIMDWSVFTEQFLVMVYGNAVCFACIFVIQTGTQLRCCYDYTRRNSHVH